MNILVKTEISDCVGDNIIVKWNMFNSKEELDKHKEDEEKSLKELNNNPTIFWRVKNVMFDVYTKKDFPNLSLTNMQNCPLYILKKILMDISDEPIKEKNL